MIVPDREYILLDGTNVAGIHKSCFANFDRWGHLPWLAFHHTNGLVSDPSFSFAKDPSLPSGMRTDDLFKVSPSDISRAIFLWVAAPLA